MGRYLFKFGFIFFMFSATLCSLTIEPVKTFRNFGYQQGYLNRPKSMSSFKQNLYLVDSENRRVSVFNHDFKFRFEFDSILDEDDELASLEAPAWIHVDRSGRVFLVETESSLIHQFDSFGRYIKTFGGFGLTGVQFNQPMGLSTDEFGFLYLADSENNSIVKLNENGELLFRILPKEGNLKMPRDVIILKDLSILVLDSEGVKKYSELGRFQKHLIKSDFVSDFAVDRNENIYLVNAKKGLFSIYSSKGELFSHVSYIKQPTFINIYESDLFITDTKDHAIYKFQIN